MTNYSKKLRDPRWQKKRLEVLERDNWKCKKCGDDKHELHVHHLRYSGEPWDVELEDLDTLCALCHKAIEVLNSAEYLPAYARDYKNYNITKSEGRDGWTIVLCLFKNQNTGCITTFDLDGRFDNGIFLRPNVIELILKTFK